MNEQIRIYTLPVEGPPEIKYIDNTLETVQQQVDGDIGTVGTFRRGVVLVVNANAALQKRPPNPHVLSSTFYGDVFLVRVNPPEFVSLTDEDIEQIKALAVYR